MKIAIIGAGFSGLAIAYHFQKRFPKALITIFDKKGVGKGASAAASGLLEPYGGQLAIRNLRGTEAMYSSLDLLRKMSQFKGYPLFEEGGIYHKITKTGQEKLYQEAAKKDQRLLFTEQGLFVKEGVSVYSELYLETLFDWLLGVGVTFRQEIFTNPKPFDHIFYACGYGIRDFFELRVRFIKGQALKVKGKRVTAALVGKGYIINDHEDNFLHLGSTYEHQFTDDAPHLKRAQELIYPRIEGLIEMPEKLPIQSVKSGIRVIPIDQNFPIFKRLDDRYSILTALGSKGLLYHSLLAYDLVQAF